MMSGRDTSQQLPAFSPPVLISVNAQPALFEPEEVRGPATQAGEAAEQGDSAEERVEWTEDEIVMLHGILFDTCEEKLRDPETPLDEVLDWLRWIFSEPAKEARAFSFANCLKLYQRPNARALRDDIREGLHGYLGMRLLRYPSWVAEAFWQDPERVGEQLERNPQWINETLSAQAKEGDLFAA
jgi:hypothetical protein